MRKNHAITLTCAAAALAAAVWWYRAQASDIPDDAQSASLFLCAACRHVQVLTDREFDRQQAFTRQVLSENNTAAETRAGRAAGEIRVLACPKCGAIESRPARRCPQDDSVFIDPLANGARNACPKCRWSPDAAPRDLRTASGAP